MIGSFIQMKITVMLYINARLVLVLDLCIVTLCSEVISYTGNTIRKPDEGKDMGGEIITYRTIIMSISVSNVSINNNDR